MPVYFVQAGPMGPIKIGFAASVAARIGKMQADNPYPLTLLAQVDGGAPEETALHTKFEAHRMRGEWFFAVPVILEYIAALPPSAKHRPRKERVPMTRLDAWLIEQDISSRKFAVQIGTSDATLSRIRSGECRPRWALIAKIALATGGAVTANDFALSAVEAA